MSSTTIHIDEISTLVGKELGPSRWLEITQEQINEFASSTGDHQWIHTDPERAATGPFGSTIAHGYLTLSLVIPLWAEMIEIEGTSMGVNYGLNKARFISPVPVKGKVRLHATIVELREIPNGIEAIVDGSVELEGAAKPACALQAIFRYLK